MNLVADEGVDRAVVERLRRDGHEVVYVAELSPSVADEEVLQEANARSAVLLTADKDFGELVFRRASYTPGSSCSAWRAWRTRPRRRSWPRSVVIAQRNSSERSASCRQDRSGFGERHDDPRGSNFGMQPTACGRG